MRRSVLTLTAACLFAAIAAPASADPAPEDLIEVHIQVAPADLESDAAVANLYQRVNDAAASVCAEAMSGSYSNLVSPYSSRVDCRRQVVEEALKDTPYAPLARYYAQVRGRTLPTEIASR